jgi:hypothetical protein
MTNHPSRLWGEWEGSGIEELMGVGGRWRCEVSGRRSSGGGGGGGVEDWEEEPGPVGKMMVKKEERKSR